MKTVFHPAHERGRGEYEWLSTRYSFSFANWYEPTRMGFGALRVLNDDRIAPSSGFPMHSHKDMEIVTIPMTGAVTHEDSLGNHGVVPAGDVQVMSAGTGVTHSERNDSETEELTLFQIWITSKTAGIEPHYAQNSFNFAGGKDPFTLVVSPLGASEGLTINQDAYLYHAALGPGHPVSYGMRREGNGAYAFVIDGSVSIEGKALGPRDAVGIWEAREFSIAPETPATLLIIEVPMSAD